MKFERKYIIEFEEDEIKDLCRLIAKTSPNDSKELGVRNHHKLERGYND